VIQKTREILKMKKEYIAWDGDKYVIEWHLNEQGKSPVREYFNDLSKDGKDKLLKLFYRIDSQGKIFNKELFNYEGDHIFAFKPKPDRFLCFFFAGSKIIVTNAFEKKQDKLPPKEKDKALKLKEDYTNRTRKGTYYD